MRRAFCILDDLRPSSVRDVQAAEWCFDRGAACPAEIAVAGSVATVGDAVNADALRAFRYMRCDTLVATEAPAHLQWLRDCLEPHFHSEATHNGDWRVAFSANPELFRKVTAQRLCTSDETVPFFALDSRIITLPRWNASDADETVAFDEEFDVFFIVRRARREVDVLARDLRPWGRVALLRVVRELATEEAVADDGVFLHAAAFERDGVTYVIAGPKNAGKTTLLIHALTCDKARFVANDRVLLLRSSEGYVVRGMPTLVNVRAGTRRFFTRFFDPHRFGPDSGCLTREEREIEQRSVVARSEEALILNPRQFAEALGTTSSTGGRLGAILFPMVSVGATNVELADLPPAVARDLLISALFPTVARYGRPTAFGGRPSDASIGRELPSRVEAQRIPLLRCVLGPHAYERGATAWLDQLRRRIEA